MNISKATYYITLSVLFNIEKSKKNDIVNDPDLSIQKHLLQTTDLIFKLKNRAINKTEESNPKVSKSENTLF